MLNRSVDLQRQEISVKEFAGVFLRQRWLILIIFVIAFLIGGIVILVSPTLYGSSVRLVVQAPTYSSASSRAQNDPVQSVMVQDYAPEIQDQVELLSSPKVIGKAFDGTTVTPPTSPEESANIISAHQVGLSSAIDVTVSLPDQKDARVVAEQIPLALSGVLQQPGRDNLKGAQDFLDSRLKEEKAALEQARKDLRDFEAKHPSQTVEGAINEAQGRIASAQNSFQATDAAVAGSEKRLATLERSRSAVPKVVDQSSSDLNVRVEDQRHELSLLEAQRSNLLAQYLPTSPEVQAVDSEIKVHEDYLKSLPSQLNRKTVVVNPELQRIDDQIVTAKAELQAAMAQRDKASNYLAQAQKHLLDLTTVTPKIQELGSRVVAAQQSVQLAKSRVDDLKSKRKTLTEPVLVLFSRDLGRNSPRIGFVLSMSAFIALLLAIPAALLREKIEDRIVSPEDLEELFGAPVIGSVPMVRPAAVSGRFGPSAALERYRALSFNLNLDSGSTQVKTLVVVSASSLEARSQVSYNLATEAANDGRSVVLVDLNIRTPQIARLAKQDNGSGLADVLTGKIDLSTAEKKVSENLTIITAGQMIDNPSQAIVSDAFRDLLVALEAKYDLVVIDGVPLTLAADSRLAAKLADGVLIVAQENVTKRRSLRFTVDMLKRSGAQILGIVFIDPSRRRATDLRIDI